MPIGILYFNQFFFSDSSLIALMKIDIALHKANKPLIIITAIIIINPAIDK